MARFLSKTPKCEIVSATKEVVDELLAANTANRAIRTTHKSYLRRQIELGNYWITNQGVGVDVRGVLIDGQHRLEAIAAAGYPPILLLVVYGLPLGAATAIDIGIKRTMADILQFAFDRPEATSSMISTTRAWAQCTKYRNRGFKPSAQEMLEWYLALLPALERMLAIPRAATLPAPVLAAIAHRMSAVKADSRPLDFLRQVLSGANLDEDAPALKLRNALAKKHLKGTGQTLQQDRFDRASTALLAFLENRKMTRLYASVESAELTAA